MKQHKLNNTYGVICSVLSAVFFGFTPLIAKNAYRYGYSSYMVAFARFVIGAVFLFIICCQKKYKITLPRKQMFQIFIIAVFYSMMILLMYTSYEYIDSGLTTTLHFSYPVFVIFITALFGCKKLRKRELLSAVLAVAGIIFLNNGNSHPNYLGVTLAVLSGLSYAFYIFLTEKYELNDVPVFVLTFWISVYSSIMVGAAVLVTPKPTINFSFAGIGFLVLLAFTTNVAAIVLFQKGLALCGGVKASLLSTLEPVTSVTVGLIVFNEQLTLSIVIGTVLILVSTIALVKK